MLLQVVFSTREDEDEKIGKPSIICEQVNPQTQLAWPRKIQKSKSPARQ